MLDNDLSNEMEELAQQGASERLRNSLLMIGISAILLVVGNLTISIESVPYAVEIVAFVCVLIGSLVGLIGLFMFPGALGSRLESIPAYAAASGLVLVIMGFFGHSLSGGFGAVFLAAFSGLVFLLMGRFYFDLPVGLVVIGLLTLIGGAIAFLLGGALATALVAVAGTILFIASHFIFVSKET